MGGEQRVRLYGQERLKVAGIFFGDEIFTRNGH